MKTWALLATLASGCTIMPHNETFETACGLKFYGAMHSQDEWQAYEARAMKALDGLGLWENSCYLLRGLRVQVIDAEKFSSDGEMAFGDMDCGHGILRLNNAEPQNTPFIHEVAHFMHPAGCYSEVSYEHTGLYWTMVKWQFEEARK